MAGRATDNPPTVRCAIYTRKSTEEGLEQEFNSLDAQREAGEAYIASQKSEGWVCLPDRYDDGGFTGGNMDRPALKRLLADIEAGQGRLRRGLQGGPAQPRACSTSPGSWRRSRQHKVSFVSVTQQFNTTHVDGPADAEHPAVVRPVRAGDHLRADPGQDRRRPAQGEMVRRHAVLGYDVDSAAAARLLVNEDEAARVRAIFELYLEHESLIPTVEELDARGWTTKQWTTKKGREVGGSPFDKNSLFKLLTNVLYLGQDHLQGRGPRRRARRPSWTRRSSQRVQACSSGTAARAAARCGTGHGALLKGLMRCVPCDCAWSTRTPSRTAPSATATTSARTPRNAAGTPARRKSVPAAEIERFVVEQIRAIGKDTALLAETLAGGPGPGQGADPGSGGREEEPGTGSDGTTPSCGTGRGARNGTATDRMADLQDRIRAAEQRSTQVREELIALGRELVDEQEVARRRWPSSTRSGRRSAPREQARVIRL